METNKSSFYNEIVEFSTKSASIEFDKKCLEYYLRAKIKSYALQGKYRKLDTQLLPHGLNDITITNEMMLDVLKIFRAEGFEVSNAKYSKFGLVDGPYYTISW